MAQAEGRGIAGAFEMIVEFIIPGEPVAKARARVTRNGAFTPKKSAGYEKLVKDYASLAMRGKPHVESAIIAYVYIFMPIPKSWSKKKKALAENVKIYPTKKPDIDNILKSVFDACNGIVYADDSQIVMISAIQQYSENPRIEVTFAKLGDAA